MRDVVLNLAIGWAALLSLILVIGAARMTVQDIRKSEKKAVAVADAIVLWAILLAGTYFAGRFIHGQWS